MNKSFKKAIAIISLVLMFLLGACSTIITNAEHTNPIKIWGQNENGCYNTAYVVDEKTGVNYIVVSAQSYSNAITVTMCPRYNADGSLYVG